MYMYIHIHAHKHILHTHTWTYTFRFITTCMHIGAHTHTHTHTHMCLHMQTLKRILRCITHMPLTSMSMAHRKTKSKHMRVGAPPLWAGKCGLVKDQSFGRVEVWIETNLGVNRAYIHPPTSAHLTWCPVEKWISSEHRGVCCDFSFTHLYSDTILELILMLGAGLVYGRVEKALVTMLWHKLKLNQ